MSRPRVVVLRALGLGDLLTGVPALRAVADAYPAGEHDLVLAAPAALQPLVELADLPFRLVDHRGLDPLPRELHGPAVAVNLHGRGPQSHAALQALAPGRLIAFGDAAAWREGEHEVERWCRMLREHGIPADPTRLELRTPAGGVDSATVVHPGAASGARRWPAERFAAVARAERAAGRDVVVTGGPDEVELAHHVAALAELPAESVRAGTTDLAGLAALVGAAARVVCGDTGVAHLATALGTPSVLLFGPTPPAEWGPLPAPAARRDRHRVLWHGGRGDPHGDAPDLGLLRIKIPDVLAALDELPASSATAA